MNDLTPWAPPLAATAPEARKRTRLSERDGRSIRARYDAAQTNEENRNHWAAVDGLSAEAANTLPVRTLLRNRSRYEIGNNSYLDGILDTLAIDTIGPTGPRLQMLTDDDPFDSAVEEEIEAWAEEICLAEKFRTLRRGRAEMGEPFLVWSYNPGLESAVKLDLDIFEGDQFSDPTWTSTTSPLWCDGIQYDGFGNPISYRRLLQHPGSQYFMGANPLAFEDIPARFVFHYFARKRAGQRRGIPEITASLSDWPELRRYCKAVIAAAETAADYAMTIESDAPANADDAEMADPMDEIELQRRMATVLPQGYKLGQTRAEQPTTTYGDFVDKKLAEGSRCLQMPFTIAALDSSSSNLAARYLDSQIYAKAIKTERHTLSKVLNKTLDFWLTEALRLPGFLPPLPQGLRRVRRKWNWDSVGEHADPSKVATGQGQQLKNGTTSIPDLCADKGQDWEDVQAKNAKALGLSIEEYRKRLTDTLFPQTAAPAGSPGAPDDPNDPGNSDEPPGRLTRAARGSAAGGRK